LRVRGVAREVPGKGGGGGRGACESNLKSPRPSKVQAVGPVLLPLPLVLPPAAVARRWGALSLCMRRKAELLLAALAW
jgi:hypothetical protein